MNNKIFCQECWKKIFRLQDNFGFITLEYAIHMYFGVLKANKQHEEIVNREKRQTEVTF